MLEVRDSIHPLYHTDIEREVPAPVSDRAAERSRPFRIGMTDNTVIRASVLVIDIFPVPGFQIMHGGVGGFACTVSAQACHTVEAADGLSHPQNIGLTQEIRAG